MYAASVFQVISLKSAQSCLLSERFIQASNGEKKECRSKKEGNKETQDGTSASMQKNLRNVTLQKTHVALQRQCTIGIQKLLKLEMAEKPVMYQKFSFLELRAESVQVHP